MMKRMMTILPALFFAAALLVRPLDASHAVQSGLSLCGRTVIPALFPLFAVTAFLLQSGATRFLHLLCAPLMIPLFHLRGVCAVPLLAGLVGGYPTGAKTTAELYEQGTITKAEAELLLGFCNNCGPGFLLGFTGSVLGSPRLGAYLLVVHTTAALLTGMILCRLPRRWEPPSLPCSLPALNVSLPQALTRSVSSALASTLSICAYVVLFQTAAAMLPDLSPAVVGAVELVSGITMLSPDRTGFLTAAALIGWGGCSVHCQTMAVTGDLSIRYHTAGKLLQAILSIPLALIAFSLQ